MMLKKFGILAMLIVLASACAAQDVITSKYKRINFLNPRFEIEKPTGQRSSIAYGVGVGYTGSYDKISRYVPNGVLLYTIAPFIDVQQKYFYNWSKRVKKAKRMYGNASNFVSGRFMVRGNSIESNVVRTDDIDFFAGPTWGLQRTIGRTHILFDMGPIFYFDTIGNHGIWWIHLQLNIGLNLK